MFELSAAAAAAAAADEKEGEGKEWKQYLTIIYGFICLTFFIYIENSSFVLAIDWVVEWTKVSEKEVPRSKTTK